MSSGQREKTFVVRMWRAEGSEGAAAWRGSVQEIRSGKRLFVTGTRDIADFILAHLTGDEETETQ
jgi:hypothetical protein